MIAAQAAGCQANFSLQCGLVFEQFCETRPSDAATKKKPALPLRGTLPERRTAQMRILQATRTQLFPCIPC